MNIINIANKVFQSKGNLLKINFIVNENDINKKLFSAFVPDDQLFGAIKDILLNREYEYLPEFELNRFKGKRIVDAGAHVGLFSLARAVHLKAGDISPIENLLRINKFDTKKFTQPLIKKSVSYSIENKDLIGLKIFRKLIYGLSTLVRAKDDTLAFLFCKL